MSQIWVRIGRHLINLAQVARVEVNKSDSGCVVCFAEGGGPDPDDQSWTTNLSLHDEEAVAFLKVFGSPWVSMIDIRPDGSLEFRQ